MKPQHSSTVTVSALLATVAADGYLRLMDGEGFTDYDEWRSHCANMEVSNDTSAHFQQKYPDWTGFINPDQDPAPSCMPDGCPAPWCPDTRGTTNSDIFARYGADVDTALFENKCDRCTERLEFSHTYTILGEAVTGAYLSDDALFSFNNAWAHEPTENEWPEGELVLSAYWIDIGLDVGGNVWWRETDADREVDELVRVAIEDPDYESTGNVIVTFDSVGVHFSRCIDRSATHQTILTTNGNATYVVYNYGDVEFNAGYSPEDEDPCNGLFPASWPFYGALAGVSSKATGKDLGRSGTPDMIDIETDTNVGIIGQYVLKIDDTDEQLCFDNDHDVLSWYMGKWAVGQLADSLYDVGGYGPFLNPTGVPDGRRVGGQPVCPLDSLIAKYVRNKRCLAMEPLECQDYRYCVTVRNTTCDSADCVEPNVNCVDPVDESCSHLRCESDTSSLYELVTYLAQNEDAFDGCEPVWNDSERHGGSGISRNMCCLGSLRPYSSLFPESCSFDDDGIYFYQ